MSKRAVTQAVWDSALERARAIAAVVPEFVFAEPKGEPEHVAGLARFDVKVQPQPYGCRFLYRDVDGDWHALDALTSAKQVVGIAAHKPEVARQWVAMLKKTRRRMDADMDFARPSFVMTPGFSLHFVSFPKQAGKKPVRHLPLHDGLQAKPRAKLLDQVELTRAREPLNPR